VRTSCSQPLSSRADLDLTALSSHYLEPTSDERRFLLAWASACAFSRSVREICREYDWPRETFKRKRKIAYQIIADGLNRAGAFALKVACGC
jgi:hypothetical protein